MNFSEGDYFAVPLPSGGYAVGLIARMKASKKPACLFLGYFFPRRFSEVPPVDEVSSFVPEDAALVARTGILGLSGGAWIRLGKSQPWHREAWPMPVFFRQNAVSRSILAITYSDDDPSKLESEVPTSNSVQPEHRDGLFGDRAIANWLEVNLR